MNLILTDKTGDVEARIFDNVSKIQCSGGLADSFVQVEGNATAFNGRIQIHIKDVVVLREDEVEIEEFLAPSFLNVDKLYAELKGIIGSMQDPFYKALMESVFVDDAEIVTKFKKLRQQKPCTMFTR